MRIEDYAKAKCELYRVPEVDIMRLSAYIESRTVKLWESGINASVAHSELLQDKNIVGTIRDKIADNILFQRRQEIARLQRQHEEETKTYQEEAEKEKAAATAAIEQQRSSVLETYNEKKEELSTARASKTAAQTRLDSMRSKVRARIDELGGMDSYKNLMKIEEMLTEDKPTPSTKPKEKTPEKPPESGFEKPPKKDLEELIGEPKEKKKSALQRFWIATKKVLFYELW